MEKYAYSNVFFSNSVYGLRSNEMHLQFDFGDAQDMELASARYVGDGV